VKSVSHLLADAPSLSDLFLLCRDVQHPLNEGSFAVEVQTHARKLSDEMRRQFITELVTSLSVTSHVNLKNPDRLLFLSLQYHDQGPLIPIHVYVSIFITEGNAKFPDHFALPSRSFINTTSMDSPLALYSAIQGLLGPGKVVLDPFCGSGSLLIAAASLGSFVIGCDFNRSSMYQTDEHSIFANFRQYNLRDQLLGLVQADFLKDNFRGPPFLDGIITDPPYGIREKCVAEAVSPLLPLLLKLYEIAAKLLKIGGRLIYWLPAGYGINVEKELPTHPALKLLAHSRQNLGSRYCRELITIEKIEEIEAQVVFEAPEASWLKVRQLVFTKVEEYRGKNRREKKKFAKELKIRLHGLDGGK
jgi:tRNA (guanine10-N2)-methyltransferase